MSTNKAIFAHQRTIGDIASDLRDMASAAHLLGQDRLAAALSECAAEMEQSCREVVRAYSDELGQYLTESQRSVGKTLMALLDATSPTSSALSNSERKDG